MRELILARLSVAVTRRPVVDEAVAVVVTAGAEHYGAVARWIDSARIGCLVYLERSQP